MKRRDIKQISKYRAPVIGVVIAFVLSAPFVWLELEKRSDRQAAIRKAEVALFADRSRFLQLYSKLNDLGARCQRATIDLDEKLALPNLLGENHPQTISAARFASTSCTSAYAQLSEWIEKYPPSPIEEPLALHCMATFEKRTRLASELADGAINRTKQFYDRLNDFQSHLRKDTDCMTRAIDEARKLNIPPAELKKIEKSGL